MVVQPTHFRHLADSTQFGRMNGPRYWRIHIERSVHSPGRIIVDVGLQYSAQMPLVQPDHRAGLDQRENLWPARPQAREPDPEYAIGGPKLRAGDALFIDRDLMPQGDVRNAFGNLAFLGARIFSAIASVYPAETSYSFARAA